MATFTEDLANGCSPVASGTSLDERLKSRHSASKTSPPPEGPTSETLAARNELRKQLLSEDFQKYDQPHTGKGGYTFSSEALPPRTYILLLLGLLTLLALSFLAFRQSHDLGAGELSFAAQSLANRQAAASASSSPAARSEELVADSQARASTQHEQLAAAADCLKEALAKQLKQEGLEESLEAAEVSHNAHLKRRKKALKQSPVASWEDAWSRVLVPTYSCPREVRLGPWGPGGWWVCQVSRRDRKLLSQSDAGSNRAAVISAGGVTDGSFEKELAAALGKGTVTHLVDHESTASGDGIRLLRKELTGSKYQKRMSRKGNKRETQDTVTLEGLVSTLGHRFSIFKLDCKSCEAGVVEDMQKLSTREKPLFDQVLMTLHRATNVAAIRAVVSGLEALGYRMFHAEPEVKSKAGFRVSFIHECLVAPGSNPESASISVCQPTGILGGDKRKWSSFSSCLLQSMQQLRSVSSMKWALRRSQRSFTANLKQRKGGLRALQGRSIQDRRVLESLLLVPQYPCAQEERMGEWGDGGKWLCMTHLSSLKEKWSPKVISIGSTKGAAFEAELNKRFGSVTDVFDLSLDAAAEKELSNLSFIRVHRLGLTGTSSVESLNKKQPGMWADVHGLMRATRASFVDILKIDCEGCETEVVKDLMRISKRSSPLFAQILMELHDLEDVGATAGLLLGLESLGYRMFHAEATGYCHTCYEVAFVHESLVDAKAKELHLNSALVLPSVKACLVSSSL